MANMPNIATIINGVFPPRKQSMAFQQAYDSREKPVTKALPHPPDDRSDAWISVHFPPKSCRYGQGRDPDWAPGSWISSPMRKVIQDWSIRRADRSRGHMQQYRELGYELDKIYRILSTSTGRSGSSDIWGKGFRSSYFLFVGHLREARELGGLILATAGGLARMAKQPFSLFFVPWILEGFFFLYLGNSVFMDPIRGPDNVKQE